MPSFAEVSRVILLLAALASLMAVLRARPSYKPMAVEWRNFLFEFVRSNTGICWAFLIILMFFYGLFHAAHDRGYDDPLVGTMKDFLFMAAGWMGNMLTGTPAGGTRRATDAPALPSGVAGSQKVTTTSRIETEVDGIEEGNGK